MKTVALQSLVLWAISLLKVSWAFGNSNKCDSVVSEWLADLEAVENLENATLTVNWGGLATQLAASNCPKDLTLELWRVLEDNQQPRRDEGFGSQDYFKEFERCTKLEPEHFVYHSKLTFNANQSEAIFLHAVEQEYMFRICPCVHRRHQRVCDCHASVSGGRGQQPQCSRVLRMSQTVAAKVMSWCRPIRPQNTASSSIAHPRPAQISGNNDMKEEISLKSLLMNCTHLLVAGRMASCTPIQGYDRVILTFHKLENKSSDKCWQARDFGTHNPVKVVSRLFSQNPLMENFSDGVGDFTAIVGLSPDSSYCVQLEHLDHPYCSSEITLGHSLHNRLPVVCSAHMAKPISTAACAALPSDVVTNYSMTHDTVFIAIVFCLSLLVMIIVVCTGYKCYFSGNPARRKNKNNRLQSAENEPMISKILSGGGAGGHSLDSTSVAFATSSKVAKATGFIDTSLQINGQAGKEDHHKVFLLHFDDEGSRCRQLRQWMGTLVQVLDIDDEDEDEAINMDPEGWVLSHLSKKETQVVVVACKSVTRLLRSSVAASSLASTTSSQISSGSSTQGAEASDMLTYTSSCSSQRSFTDDSMEDDSMEATAATAATGDKTFEATAKAYDDPRRDLRVFALKYIQAHLVGKYNRLAVVSFDKSNMEGDSAAYMLTPHKSPLVLPHHMSDLENWLLRIGPHQTAAALQHTVRLQPSLQNSLRPDTVVDDDDIDDDGDDEEEEEDP